MRICICRLSKAVGMSDTADAASVAAVDEQNVNDHGGGAHYGYRYAHNSDSHIYYNNSYGRDGYGDATTRRPDIGLTLNWASSTSSSYESTPVSTPTSDSSTTPARNQRVLKSLQDAAGPGSDDDVALVACVTVGVVDVVAGDDIRDVARGAIEVAVSRASGAAVSRTVDVSRVVGGVSAIVVGGDDDDGDRRRNDEHNDHDDCSTDRHNDNHDQPDDNDSYAYNDDAHLDDNNNDSDENDNTPARRPDIYRDDVNDGDAGADDSGDVVVATRAVDDAVVCCGGDVLSSVVVCIDVVAEHALVDIHDASSDLYRCSSTSSSDVVGPGCNVLMTSERLLQFQPQRQRRQRRWQRRQQQQKQQHADFDPSSADAMVLRHYTGPKPPPRSSSSEQVFTAEASVTVAGPVGKNHSDGSSERSDERATCSRSSQYGWPSHRPGLTFEQAQARDARHYAATSSAGLLCDVDVVAATDVDDHNHDDDTTHEHDGDDDVVVDANIVADDDGDVADDSSDVDNHGTTVRDEVVSFAKTSVAIAFDFAYIDSTSNARLVSHAMVRIPDRGM